MAYVKLTGNTAIIGGPAVLSAPTIYGAGSYSKTTTSSTSVTKIYGSVRINETTTETTKGGINLGGLILYVKKIRIASSAMTGTTSLYDTTWDAPYKSIIEDVFLITQTVATSATHGLTVGIAGTANNLVANFNPAILTYTPSGAAATPYYGTALLKDSTSATYNKRVPYYTAASTSRSITVSRAATSFSTAWVGHLFIKYLVPSS